MIKTRTRFLIFLSVFGLLVLSGWGLLNFLFDGWGDDEKWSRDYRPEGIYLEDLILKGYPSSIYRVVEAGEFGPIGDGTRVEVLCFRGNQLEEMKAFLSTADQTTGKWQSGPPQNGYSGLGDRLIPKDLQIPVDWTPSDYLHYNMGPGSGRSLIIDTKRLIAYRISVST